MAEHFRSIFEAAGPRHHIGLFYADLDGAIAAAKEYTLAGLREGDFVCLVVPAEECEAWTEFTTGIDEGIRKGTIPDRFASVFYPMTEIATGDGRVKVDAFLKKIARLAALREARHLRVVGRLLSPLWEDGWEEAPLQAEEQVGLDGVSFLCLYDLTRSADGGGDARLKRMMARHPKAIRQSGTDVFLS